MWKLSILDDAAHAAMLAALALYALVMTAAAL